MPSYSNALPPSAIWPGDFAQVWNAEQPAPGSGGASASRIAGDAGITTRTVHRHRARHRGEGKDKRQRSMF